MNPAANHPNPHSKRCAGLNTPQHALRPTPHAARASLSTFLLALLLLAAAPGLAQDDLTNEQLIRRAHQQASAPTASNSPAPATVAPVVVPTPAAPAEDIPEFTGNARATKPKATGFSEVPPDFFAPVAPATNAPPLTNAMAALDAKHILAIGDRLSFRIVEDEEDPRALVVTDSGELEVPYLGRFAAAGKTCQELALALKAELEKEYYYRATVIIAVDLMARSRGKVYLVGPVGMPGPQEIPSDEVLTISKAVLRAGGFTAFADKKNVKITRKNTTAGGEDQTFTVNVGEILEQGRTETDLPLRPGDLIYIQERMIRF